MKVLYLSQGQFNDYQCDMLFHGLRSLLGPEVVDVNRIWAMYRTGGGGYTVYGLLPDDSYVDRTDIPKKIATRFFDLVIYGSIWHDLSFYEEVVTAYPPNRVAFVDGLDDDSRVMLALEGRGVYFKREPSGPPMPRLPIQFAIPREKIVPDEQIQDKNRLMAPLDPRDRSTYIYTDEAWYYRQYRESYFGYTMKKGGWDCLRHYEILAAGCMPYFAGIEAAPDVAMEHLPRPELLRARQMYDNWKPTPSQVGEYRVLLDKLRTVLREKMTTEAMAKRVLERMMQ